MFDAHIQFFCYHNTEGDDFGVGYLGNKEYWVHLMNGWNRNDGRPHKYTIEEWDDLEEGFDFRGCRLAEVVPDDQAYIISWFTGDNENNIRITHDNQIIWEINETKSSSAPRWVARLKNQLRDTEN